MLLRPSRNSTVPRMALLVSAQQAEHLNREPASTYGRETEGPRLAASAARL